MSFTDPSPERFVVTLVLSTILSLLVFRHADGRGNRRATAWGIATFLLAPFVVPFYFIRYWLRRRS